ncbi:NAD-P-binding protein [Amylocystis lapponica]|nr:NAD-P-binding protein [Amylocystis lapponica]
MGSAFSSSKGFTPESLPDLTGKVMIVTGGNAGVGFAAVQHLARRGAKVYLAARSEERAKAALERLHAAGLGPGNGEVVWLHLDLSDPRVAKKAAETVLEKEKRLDVVVNCAALLMAPFAKAHDDIQDVVVVNYLSPFVFVRDILPLLKQTASEPYSDVRVVNVVSDDHKRITGEVHFRSIDDFNVDYKDSNLSEFYRYWHSKLMEVLYVKELQRRLDTEDALITVMAVHPGLVNTEGIQAYVHSTGPILSRLITFITNFVFVPASEGAYSTVFAAASPTVQAERDKYRGAYLVPPGTLAHPSKLSESTDLAKELWETTERVLEDIGV